MEEHEEIKETQKKRKFNTKDLTEKIRKNPWVLATVLLSVFCLILLVISFSGNLTGNVSQDKVGTYLVEFYNSKGFAGLELESVGIKDDFYIINASYQGETIPFYVTKTGYLVGNSLLSIVPVKTSTTNTEVVKSDKPTAELYIWSYCPYGVTALAPFADVAKLLGSFADFKVYLYYAGHGDFEEQQNKIQACVQESEPEKYWDYAKAFAENIYTKCSGDKACDLKESTALMKSLGIDSAKVLSCVETQGKQLLEEHSDAAQSAGVQGSPTLIINGVQTSVSRTAEAYKGAVCSAFNDVPSACSQTLDSTGSTASGNC